jgi:hypothetical protein
VQNPRQIVGEPLHPQAMQIDPSAFRSEMPAPVTVSSTLVARIEVA